MEKVIVITKEEFFNALDQRFEIINNQLSERLGSVSNEKETKERIINT